MSTTTPTESIELTDSAVAKVAELLAQEGQDDLALRVAVRPGGCSGFSYEMFFDSEKADDDVVLTFDTGATPSVHVWVDPASNKLLLGATLDYKDSLQGGGFAINNPNAQRTCGCGQSFS
ncbi:MAG TPA: iron-sulfur cluster insertion protein ErpA [Acidimicrobiales bacterium]|nr:iron-sulfur cluster insertion protein ErpA [Acidimicrobiales bacterium]